VPITPEEIAGKEFLELDGGYDRGEVRAFLKGLAKEHGALIERLADNDSVDDGGPGDEVTRILDAAREGAEQLLAKAERVSADRVEAGEKEATLLRDSVTAATDKLKRDADDYSEQVRAAANRDAAERVGETERRVEALLLGEARVRELLYSLEVILPDIRQDLLNAERDIVGSIERTIVLDDVAEPLAAATAPDEESTTTRA
jgi:DivIVA domain-containing protein